MLVSKETSILFPKFSVYKSFIILNVISIWRDSCQKYNKKLGVLGHLKIISDPTVFNTTFPWVFKFMGGKSEN